MYWEELSEREGIKVNFRSYINNRVATKIKDISKATGLFDLYGDTYTVYSVPCVWSHALILFRKERPLLPLALNPLL